MKNRLTVLFCIFVFSANVCATDENRSHPVVLSLPEIDWSLEINAPGFVIEDFEIAPNGDATRFQAMNKQTGIVMSGFLEKAPGEITTEDCRTSYWAAAKKSPLPKTGIKMSRLGEMALVEFMVKEYMGVEVNQKNFNAYLAESGHCIDIHLSKAGYKPSDLQYFKKVLSNVTINHGYKPDSLTLFHYGNLFYSQKRYPEAASYYQQALNLENDSRTMSKTFWLVLVDQLGMSYGISGNLDKAKEIYSAAILEEQEYPMFYYNLACTYAESNDLDGAITNLSLAYKYKNNMLPNEEFPDPRTDSSFKRFLGDKKFTEMLSKIE